MNPSGAKQATPPGLIWEDGTPASSRFQDVYYSRGEGLAEKRHVFLAGCGLPEAWRGREVFTVCELGFGTGLTFLATARLWAETAAPGARLRYLAVEGYPLGAEELRLGLAPWAELAPEAAALLRVYPHLPAGFHRLDFRHGISLTLMCGDAAAVLAACEAAVDAWYLDGFAPGKNPEMWSAAVCREVARLSHPDARLATYSAAGVVRRGLQDAGFAVDVAPGFGRKHEMTRARYAGGPHKSSAPWFAASAPMPRGRAAIIGGGVAGTAAAGALTRRGWACTLIDGRDALARGASGTPSGVVMPRLTAGHALDGRVHAGAWRYAVRSWGSRPFYTPCGVLQLGTDAAEQERLGVIAGSDVLSAQSLEFLEPAGASAAAGCALPFPALRFAEGGWINPAAYCADEAAGAALLLGHQVAALQRAGSGWRLMGNDGAICEADVVVFANAGAAINFVPWLPLVPRQGQVTAATPSPESAQLHCVLAYGGTLTPVREGVHHVGATFNQPRAGVPDDDVSATDDSRNLAQLAEALPDLAHGMRPMGAWAGVRWSSPDHLPLVGPLADAAAFARDYAPLRHGQHWVDYPPGVYESGLYVIAGFGSHGVSLAPLCAELLACHIAGEPWPLERDLVEALHPSRFLLRDLKRPK